MATKKIRAAVLGASGYTGADLIRLAARHPNITLTALIAKGHAGQPLARVFPHLATLDLPALVTSDEVDWSKVDVAFCGLPHATAHSEIAKLPKRVKVIDMFAHLGSLEFSKLLLEQASVAVSPGVGFGEYGEGYVRIALVENEQRIRQAARNIRKFLAESAKSLHNVIPLASKATRTL